MAHAVGSPISTTSVADMAKAQEAFFDGFKRVDDTMVGYILHTEQAYKCNNIGMEKARRRLNRMDVAKHRPEHVATRLDKRRYGKVSGSGT